MQAVSFVILILMNLKFTGKPLLTHLFFLFMFLVLPTIVFERLPGESVFSVTRVIVQDTIANFILLCFFYLNYYWLIPKFYFEHRYVLYVIIVILFLSITFPLPHLIGAWIPDNHRMGPEPFPPPDIRLHQPDHPPPGIPDHMPVFYFSLDEFRRHLYLFFTAIFFSFLLRTREHLSQLKEDKLNAELLSLKAQINPHFLFNTLNTIYALSVKKDDKASEAIVHLSGLMRYVTKDVNNYKIPLRKEIDYIINYIELQKARLGNTVTISFNVQGDTGNKQITPLILITYIENALKYGVNPDVDGCVVDIGLKMNNYNIELKTRNKKVSNLNSTESTGIGMKNTDERLKYLYPQKHKLEIIDDGQTYYVKLLLELI
jgi:hypothetical protein